MLLVLVHRRSVFIFCFWVPSISTGSQVLASGYSWQDQATRQRLHHEKGIGPVTYNSGFTVTQLGFHEDDPVHQSVSLTLEVSELTRATPSLVMPNLHGGSSSLTHCSGSGCNRPALDSQHKVCIAFDYTRFSDPLTYWHLGIKEVKCLPYQQRYSKAE